jgi:Rieske Fe-S protein
MSETTRRNVILGVAAAGVAAPVLAACGSSGSTRDTTGTSSDPAATRASDPTTIKVSDIPVGGGRIYPDQQLVVTQPKAGDFKAFSAVCTHQGCILDDVSDGFIKCPCHGSMFAIATGKPTADSFARSPLPKKKIAESGADLTVS